MSKMISTVKPTGCGVCAKPTPSTANLCRNSHPICSGCAKKVNFCPLCQTLASFVPQNGLSSSTELNVQLYLNSDFEGNNQNPNGPRNRVHSNGWNTIALDGRTAVDCAQLIHFGNKLFWYKHKINVMKQVMHWSVQFIGPALPNERYYYEVKLKPITASPKILKVWKYCESDQITMEELIAGKKCVTIPFNMLRAYSFGNIVKFQVNLCKVRSLRELPNPSHNKILPTISIRSPSMQLNTNCRPKACAGGRQPPTTVPNNYQKVCVLKPHPGGNIWQPFIPTSLPNSNVNRVGPMTAALNRYKASKRFHDSEQERLRRGECDANRRLEEKPSKLEKKSTSTQSNVADVVVVEGMQVKLVDKKRGNNGQQRRPMLKSNL